jgi:hypothetical protein
VQSIGGVRSGVLELGDGELRDRVGAADPVQSTTGQRCAVDLPVDPVGRFGLSDVDLAIRSVGGEAEEGVVHVSLLPWLAA